MKATKFFLSWVLFAGSFAVQASTYSVSAVFNETMTNGVNTFFNGSFDWDGSVVTNLHGTMNSSMYPVNNVNPDYSSTFPLMDLGFQLNGTQVAGNTVTASVFLKNTTDVYRGGGYDGVASGFIKYGGAWGALTKIATENPNQNAFFTLVFDKTTMAGVVDQMVYGDCTNGGLMGDLCMAGEITGTSAMAATPLSLLITPTAVPLPATAWLFLSAMLGLLGFNRRTSGLSVQ